MSFLGRFNKQPAEKESYSIEYSDDLVGADAIASATVLVEPAGLVLAAQLVQGTRVKVFLEGGVSGVRYKVTVTATTDDDRVLQDEFAVMVKDV